MSEEQEYWRRLINELQLVMTLRQISDELNVSERTVANWKTGDRPKGMNAIRVYTLHVKRCCTQVHEPRDITKSVSSA